MNNKDYKVSRQSKFRAITENSPKNNIFYSLLFRPISSSRTDLLTYQWRENIRTARRMIRLVAVDYLYNISTS